MNCTLCESDLALQRQSDDFSVKYYHCNICDKWYELRKDKAKANGAIAVRFNELENNPFESLSSTPYL